MALVRQEEEGYLVSSKGYKRGVLEMRGGRNSEQGGKRKIKVKRLEREKGCQVNFMWKEG